MDVEFRELKNGIIMDFNPGISPPIYNIYIYVYIIIDIYIYYNIYI